MPESDKALESNPTSGGEPLLPVEEPEENELQEINEVEEEVAQLDLEDDDDDDEDDFVLSLPESVQKRVNELKQLDNERDSIMEEYLKERAALEKKYADMCTPLYDKRRIVINDTALSEEQAASESEEMVGIPDFWTVAMSNIEVIDELITERDHECLLFLEDIRCEDYPDGDGFKLIFAFKENPYFSNKELTKTYDVPNLLLADEPILKNVKGCTITWKEGMCLTHHTVTKKQRNKKGQIRNIKKEEKMDSFFHFFTPPQIPSMSELDEEEADAIEEAFDHDYDVAQSFRSHIIPKAVLWFTGEAMESELEGVYQGSDTLFPEAILNSAPGINDSPFSGSPQGSGEPECKQQ
jgi:nucleosome assembly protein 1-like 1